MKINIENLSLSFKLPLGFVNAIDNLSFSINAGQTFALLGESGCGKSLTASAVMQLLPNNAFCHESSKIYFDEEELLNLSEQQMQGYRGTKMAMIFQEPMTSLNPVLTIEQQLKEVILKNTQTTDALPIKEQVIHLLEQVEIDEPKRRLKEYPHQFSGGQKQRIMIAMAVASKPDLLIADEPTTALDVKVQTQILALLKRLTNELDMAMLLITHDLSIVKQCSDHVGIMYAGQMVESCATEIFFKTPKHPYSKRLLQCIPSLSKRGYKLEPIIGRVPTLDNMPNGCRFKPRCLQAKDECNILPELIEDKNNHKIRCHFSDVDILNNKLTAFEKKDVTQLKKIEVLSVSDLKVHYPIYKGIFKRQVDSVKAVDGVSFSLFKGETLALVGDSGCGKTTLSRAICQLLPTTSGKIRIHNKLLQKRTKQLSSQLQIIFQDPFSSMDPRMLVRDILLEGLMSQNLNYSQKALNVKANEILDMVQLSSSSADKYPHEFSGGQRQRISIARALALKPSIIICDEPTSALDVSVQSQLLNLLLDLQEELNLSYLFISHDLDVVSYMSDRIMLMQQGKIVKQGTPESMLNSD